MRLEINFLFWKQLSTLLTNGEPNICDRIHELVFAKFDAMELASLAVHPGHAVHDTASKVTAAFTRAASTRELDEQRVKYDNMVQARHNLLMALDATHPLDSKGWDDSRVAQVSEALESPLFVILRLAWPASNPEACMSI